MKPITLFLSLSLLAGLSFGLTSEVKAQTPFFGSDASVVPALGVPVPTFYNKEDVKTYMRTLLSTYPQPGYVLPVSLRGGTSEASIELLNKRFPEFVGLQGEKLVDAVFASPYRYQEMMRDAMAIRDFYHPEWRQQRSK
ncbi:MAG: hypothetical protein MH137_02305 [Flavobacteriales bacterium]|nr:hypothetical protein [Flavobacteriales bacterium]